MTWETSKKGKAWKLAYRAKKNADSKARYIANKAAVLIKQRAYYRANKQNVRTTKRAYELKKYKTDPLFKLKKCLRVRTHAAIRGLRRSALDLLGASVETVKEYLTSLFLPGMTWDNYGTWHVDHIKPCAKFDLTIPTQQKLCFHYTNLQPLWALDNQIKGARY
jgi:hypothetical protein